MLGAQASPPAVRESEGLVANACRRGRLRSQQLRSLWRKEATKGTVTL